MAGMKVTAFWDVTLCSLIEVDQHFKSACCLHHQGNRLNDRQSAFMRLQIVLSQKASVLSILLVLTLVIAVELCIYRNF
jgi:hypothetical protein